MNGGRRDRGARRGTDRSSRSPSSSPEPSVTGHALGRQAEAVDTTSRMTCTPAAVVPPRALHPAQLLGQQLGGLVVALGQQLLHDGGEAAASRWRRSASRPWAPCRRRSRPPLARRGPGAGRRASGRRTVGGSGAGVPAIGAPSAWSRRERGEVVVDGQRAERSALVLRARTAAARSAPRAAGRSGTRRRAADR